MNSFSFAHPGVDLRAADAELDWAAGQLRGEGVQHTGKTFADLRSLFAEGDRAPLADSTVLYTVSWTGTAAAGSEGSQLFGCTHLQPGTVGDEYFMTHGHFHADPTRGEMYMTVAGEGILLLMERNGRTRGERMAPGSLCRIQGTEGHRVVNTGDAPLIFWASWPGDAGYDYASIKETGFGLRVFQREGRPILVPVERPR